MKKTVLIALIGLLPFTHANAQFWKKSESIEVFGVKFKAKQVTGQKSFLGPSDRYWSKIRNPLTEKNVHEFMNDVGTYRIDVYTSDTRSLMDLSALSTTFEHLDQIDFEFYEGYGFDNILKTNPELISDSLYIDLKAKIKTEQDYHKKKQILFQDKYRRIRILLVESRYEIVPKPFTLDKKQVSKFTAELKAKVDEVLIANNISAEGKVRAYLSQVADESVNMSGTYHAISLNNNYVGIINDYIESNIEKIREDAKKGETEYRFAKNLVKVIQNQNYVITSSLVAIQIKGTVDNNRVNITELSSELESKFEIPAEQAAKVAASVNLTFEKHETTRFEVDFNNVYIIRFFSNDQFKELKKL